MRASRRFLYWGAFFFALGGIMAVIEFGLVDEGPVVDALRLWPIAGVALGVAMVIRRTPYALPAWLAHRARRVVVHRF